MSQELTVVIIGSTGKQAGAVARGLLERGHNVRAVTRATNSSQAKSLASAGATLVAASLEGTAALTQALEGATSLFAMANNGPPRPHRSPGAGSIQTRADQVPPRTKEDDSPCTKRAQCCYGGETSDGDRKYRGFAFPVG